MAPAASPLRHFHVGIDGLSIHVAEGGAEDRPGVLFVHGWPQDWSAFAGVMAELQDDARVAAIDLPGIGLSDRPAPTSDKRTLAFYLHGVLETLGMHDVTLVGHDIGAQIVHAYLHAFPGELRRAVLVSPALPGVEPWRRNAAGASHWHYAFHAVPGLPEVLVSGHRTTYFNFFFDRLSGPGGVSARARAAYAAAYARPVALRSGFEWFRAFVKDERDNVAVRGHEIDTPVLVLRGSHEPGDIADHVAGLREAGCADVRGERLDGCGHFAPDEHPALLAGALRGFIEAHEPQASAA